jgi:hypothetical protein
MIDYFLLSRQAAAYATEAANILGETVPREAHKCLEAGFIVPAPAALEWAGSVFAEVATRPGGSAALREDTVQERADMVCAVVGHMRGLEEALDLEWSQSWARFQARVSRSLDVPSILDFAVAYRVDRDATLAKLEQDWRRHYDEEVAER